METRLLRYFAAVVEAGTVSTAAQDMHITQPALSRQLRQLEAQLGLRLFFRRSGRLQLTNEGRDFYQAALRLLQHHRDAADYAAQLAQGRMTILRFGAPTTTLTDVVAPFVATFRPEDPVPSASEVPLEADMKMALADVDMMIAPVRWPQSVPSLHLVNLPVWAYVPAQHEWARRDAVDLTKLVEETLILPTMEFKARRVLESALESAQLGPATTLETPHSQVAQALAAAGRGAAVVTDDARYDLTALRILHHGEPLQMSLYAAWRAGHYAAATLGKLSRRLAEFCRRRYPA